MVSIVRYNLTIKRSVERANARRRFRVRKMLAERAHLRPLRNLTGDWCLSSVLCVRGANPDDFHRTAGVPGYRLGYPAHQKTVEALQIGGAENNHDGMPLFGGIEDF